MSDTVEILKLEDMPEDIAEIFSLGNFPNDWTYGLGGYGLNDNQWHFNTVNFDDNYDMHEKIYVIPNCINIIIDGEARQAVSNKLNKIKRELDL